MGVLINTKRMDSPAINHQDGFHLVLVFGLRGPRLCWKQTDDHLKQTLNDFNILWHLGEEDATKGNSTANYQQFVNSEDGGQQGGGL
jgi:hypothetical protein